MGPQIATTLGGNSFAESPLGAIGFAESPLGAIGFAESPLGARSVGGISCVSR